MYKGEDFDSSPIQGGSRWSPVYKRDQVVTYTGEEGWKHDEDDECDWFLIPSALPHRMADGISASNILTASC